MSQARPGELAALTAVGVGVCCGPPVLLGAGVLGATVGIALGSTLAVAVGALAVAVGMRRWRHRRACPAEPGSTDIPSTRPGGC